MRLGVVINPSAGQNKGVVIGRQVLDRLTKTEHEIINLSGQSLGHARANLAAAIEYSEIDIVLLVGGDGMVHLGTNLCVNTNIAIAIIPAGTGNDAAQVLGMRLLDINKCVDLFLEGMSSPKRIDTIEISHDGVISYALGSASAGFDALVAARANNIKWPKGPMRYYVAMLLELASFKPIAYSSVIDGVKKDFEAMLCVVSNTGLFGGGMKVVPGALVVDGVLDLLIVKKMSRIKFVTVFPKVYKGTHITDKDVEQISAKSVQITAHGMPIYSDGEYVGRAPFEARVLESSLLVVAPAL
jgi:diacylglycerol kinase (ATP)